MKQNIFNSNLKNAFAVLFCVVSLIACNKDLPQPVPIANSAATGRTIGDTITNFPNFSFFKAAVNRVGMMPLLMDRNSRFTVFIPDNAAFIASGIPSEAAIATLPIASVGGIVTYHILPGEELPSASISTAFPNVQLPTLAGPGVNLPGTAIPFRLTSFPSKRGGNHWLNNVPFTSPDFIRSANGIVHVISRVATPPSLVVAQLIYGDPNLTLFSALIQRGGTGQPAASTFDSIIKNTGANLTVFAPTNDAMKVFVNQASGGAISLVAPDATFIGFINTSLPVASAAGLTAYHFLASPNAAGAVTPWRTFSVNFSNTATFYKTLVNASVSIHPGVSVQSFFTGNVVDSMKVLGIGLGSTIATAKPAANFDKHGINGVVHIIDAILRPQ